MDFKRAANETLSIARVRRQLSAPAPSKTGLSTGHAHWMLLQVAFSGLMTEAEACHWLGWAQCIFVRNGYNTMQEIQDINRRCK